MSRAKADSRSFEAVGGVGDPQCQLRSDWNLGLNPNPPGIGLGEVLEA